MHNYSDKCMCMLKLIVLSDSCLLNLQLCGPFLSIAGVVGTCHLASELHVKTSKAPC